MKIKVQGPVHSDVTPPGPDAAVLIHDSAGTEILRIPTPRAPHQRPSLDLLALACAADLVRQLNEVHATLLTALDGMDADACLFVHRSEDGRHLRHWQMACEVATADGVRRVLTEPVDAVRYEADMEAARTLVRRLRRMQHDRTTASHRT